MREVVGDIWAAECTVRVIPTNGVVKPVRDGYRAVMGAGLAVQAARRYPDLPEALARCIMEMHNNVHILPHDLIAFPTKHHWREPSDLVLIERSTRQLVALQHVYGWDMVALPRVGCGKGNLHWTQVQPMLSAIIGASPHFVVVDNG